MLLMAFFAKDCLLTLVKSRLALGSPGCSSPCRIWPNTQENGCCLPPSDHIQSKILFQTKQDQERGMNGPASLLHSWHWVLFYIWSGNEWWSKANKFKYFDNGDLVTTTSIERMHNAHVKPDPEEHVGPDLCCKLGINCLLRIHWKGKSCMMN